MNSTTDWLEIWIVPEHSWVLNSLTVFISVHLTQNYHSSWTSKLKLSPFTITKTELINKDTWNFHLSVIGLFRLPVWWNYLWKNLFIPEKGKKLLNNLLYTIMSANPALAPVMLSSSSNDKVEVASIVHFFSRAWLRVNKNF